MRAFRTGQLQTSPKHGSDDDCCTDTSGSAAGQTHHFPDHSQASSFEALLHEIQELQRNQCQLRECFQHLKTQHQREYRSVLVDLQEEQYRGDLLEEQLSDLTELHQNEILNLKEELASMEENIAYQSYNRATDIHEALEACQIRLFKVEQQQQAVQQGGLEYATAQTLLGKLLVFVSMVANCVIFLMKTHSCMLSSLLFVVLYSFLSSHWDAISEYLHSRP